MVVVVEVVVVHSGSPKIVPSCSSVASARPSSVASGRRRCCCCCWDHGEEASVGFSIDEHRKKDLREIFLPIQTINNNQQQADDHTIKQVKNFINSKIRFFLKT